MIQITNSSDCCGCSSCVQVCPKQCISFDEDEKGFCYPIVNMESCIDCGLCEMVCPCLNSSESIFPREVYAVKNPDENVRKESSSGGVFTMLAEAIIDQGGVVFGAKFNEKWEVVHDYTETKDGLKAFRGSKYVQSLIRDTYIKTRDFLKVGRKVLFSGTPCQVAGLRKFLRKEYDNLITVDFICHGVPSPGIFRWYLQEEINNYIIQNTSNRSEYIPIHSIPKESIKLPKSLSIMAVRFRDKQEGWKKFGFTIDLILSSNRGEQKYDTISSNLIENVFLKGFIADLYLRPSCHKCPSRNYKSGSDITVSDFWGQEYMFPDFDNDTGVSAVIIKTEKGESLYSSLKWPIQEKKSIDQVISYNKSLLFSKPETYRCKKFWSLPLVYTFSDRVNKSVNLTIAEKIYSKITSLLLKYK